MVQLMILIMGIALAGYVVMAGISYIDLDGIKSKEQQAQWSGANLALAQGWVDIERQYHRKPQSITELTAKSSLLMSIPKNFELDSITNGFAGWCIMGQASEYDKRALISLATKFPSAYGIASECGHTNGVSLQWVESSRNSTSSPVAVTYRLSAQ